MIQHNRNDKSGLLDVSIQRIRLNHDRPRRILDRDVIERMKLSLVTVGQMQPVGVRRHGNAWLLIFGYLRLRAAQQLGWKTIRATEYPETENQNLVDLALWASQNLHHAAPALDEMAGAVRRLSEAGMSASVIGIALGRTVDWVDGMLAIARDPMARRLIDTGRLVEAEAWLAFMRLSSGDRKKVLDSAEQITVRSCERIPRLSKKTRILRQTGDVWTQELWSDMPETAEAKQNDMFARKDEDGCAGAVR